MADRSRANARPAKGAHPCSPASESPAAKASKPKGSTSQLKGWRLWTFRLAAMILVPAVFLTIAEIALRICGYGYPTHFFLKTEDGQYLVSNRRFCDQFYDSRIATHPHPLLMRAVKPPGTIRVFVLGESAAAGTPDPAFGFGRILETMLRDRYPDKNIEVVNAAVRGINSHIILPIARECAQYQPDLFLVYMGNNETIGLYSPEPGNFNLAAWPNLIHFRQWIKQTRLAQLLVSITERSSSADKNVQMDYFRRQRISPDDPLRQPVYFNFQHNLNHICEAIQSSGAKMVLATVAVNLQDCPPLGSLHRKGLSTSELANWKAAYTRGISAETNEKYQDALQEYRQAATIDDHFADLHFRMARTYLGLKQLDRARQEFALARDWDALQFRTDARINEVIRKTPGSRASQDIRICDVEQALATNALSENGIPGGKLFIDQVHFTFDGDYSVACILLPEVEKTLGWSGSSKPILSRQDCALRLGFTVLDEYNVTDAGVRVTANPPFTDQIDHDARQKHAGQALTNLMTIVDRTDPNEFTAQYRKAIAMNSNDWQLHLHLGDFLKDLKNNRGAAAEYQTLVNLFPCSAPYRLKLAQAQAEIGNRADALANIKEAARLDPSHPAVKAALAWANSLK